MIWDSFRSIWPRIICAIRLNQGLFELTTESIMTSAPFTLSPTDTVAEALSLMHSKEVRNLPVVDDSGTFIGLFGLRRLSHLLLPKAALDLGAHSISDLHFLPDEVVQNGDRWHEISEQPVKNFLEKKKKLLFCTPQTALPELLALLDQSKDSSLPVIVIEGETQKVVGMVSSWEVLQAIVMGRLTKAKDSAAP
jgi:CBS-domain-containing membrane protein